MSRTAAAANGTGPRERRLARGCGSSASHGSRSNPTAARASLMSAHLLGRGRRWSGGGDRLCFGLRLGTPQWNLARWRRLDGRNADWLDFHDPFRRNFRLRH